MLQIKGISKRFVTGELTQIALDEVSLNLRDNEFVAILGPSGSGKTTLLNVIGGLDRYDSGDMIVNGITTNEYTDRDWDSYRNHTIGFVFQSYNLIPHQSILSNVELALTISGVRYSERRRRAKRALEQVGLGDQLHKRPGQMSGGQMQRVAIARALVNDPEILLADEPTGALDTETSEQVMKLLSEVAKSRLVVMVTHNSELAERYATRTVHLKDGVITDDTSPLILEDTEPVPVNKKSMGRASMSFFTALSLSFNNLRTKLGRAFLTSLAGSIGIVGIALILALSNGVSEYIVRVQRDTMAAYPIAINAETIDMEELMNMGNMSDGSDIARPDGVFADAGRRSNRDALSLSVAENDLTAFKRYLDDTTSEIHEYLGENGVVYTYDLSFDIYSYDPNGELIRSDADTSQALKRARKHDLSGSLSFGVLDGISSILGASAAGAENFCELMEGPGDELISPVITDSYELLHGKWPSAYNEVVLVLSESNTLSAGVLYQLGIISAEEYTELDEAARTSEDNEGYFSEYEDICKHEFYMIPVCDGYKKNEEGVYEYAEDNLTAQSLVKDALKLKISGVIRPKADAAAATIADAVAYTSLLRDYYIEYTAQSEVVRAQENTPEVNVLTGMRFEAATDEEKVADAAAYVKGLGTAEKAALYRAFADYSESEKPGTEPLPETSPNTSATPSPSDTLTEKLIPDMSVAAPIGIDLDADDATLSNALDVWLDVSPDKAILLSLYDRCIAGATLKDNLIEFGKVSYDAPAYIYIYTDTFEAKEAATECIARYNACVEENKRITYTDYVALIISSVTSIINIITYVLVGLVAVSLIVSSIMIGIITYISVLERTKEIGILRAIGASKLNISQVFNAETFIIGLLAGVIGIATTLVLTIPTNALLHALTGISDINASLPPGGALILIVLSVLLTFIGGLIPASKAASKNPVTALRTE